MTTSTKRLKTLSKHLRTGKLGHKKFDFDFVNAIEDPVSPFGHKPSCNTCGTVGCAMGELPVVFPDIWGFNQLGLPRLRKSTCGNGTMTEEIKKFFGIGEAAHKHLFYPGCQDPTRFGGKHLDRTATRTQVAMNIEAYARIIEAKRDEAFIARVRARNKA